MARRFTGVIGFILSGLFLFAGCSGSGQKKDQTTTAPAGLTACTPSIAAPGQAVICKVGKDFNESTTVFVGGNAFENGSTATTQQYEFDQGAGTVTVVIPANLGGKADISYCRGDCDTSRVVLAKDFQIDTGTNSSGSSAAVGATGPTGTTGTTGTSGASGTTGSSGAAAPTGSGSSITNGMAGGSSGGGSGGSAGSYDSTADSDHDGVPDTIDACPNTPASTSVDSVGCSTAQKAPPTPPTTAGSIDTFDITSAGSSALPGTFKITWSFSNAKAAYLWGNMLNRDGSDQQCDKVSGRYLLTKPDGQNWAGTESNFTDTSKNIGKFSTGTLCSSSSDCQFKMDGVSSAPSDPNAKCRIDLTNNSQLVTADSVYTRSLAQHGVACLVVQGDDDQWQVRCKEADATVADVSNSNISLATDKPAVHFDLKYGAGNTLTIGGCDGTPTQNVNGEYIGDCKLNADSMSFDVSVQGVGSGNVKKHTYTVELQDPKIEYFNVSGQQPSQDDVGPFQISYKVSRPYVIKQDGKAIPAMGTSCPWVKTIKLHGQYVINKQNVVDPSIDVKTPGDASATVTAYRDYDNSNWFLSAYKFNDNQWGTTSGNISNPIPITWTFTEDHTQDGWAYDDNSTNCNGTDHLIPRLGVFTWKAQNVKSVTVVESNVTVTGGMPKDQKGTQVGAITVQQDLGHYGQTFGKDRMLMNFTWHVVGQDGKSHDVPFSANNWSCGQ